MSVFKPWAVFLAALVVILSAPIPGPRAQSSAPIHGASQAQPEAKSQDKGQEKGPAQGKAPETSPAKAGGQPPGQAEGQAAPAATDVPAKAPTFPPDAAIQDAREKLDANRAALDNLDAALKVEGLRAVDLDELRSRLDPLRREIFTRSDALSARLVDVKARLAELGSKPADGAPPEDPATTLDRERRQALSNEIEAALKQNVALAARAEQVSDRINTRRRALFTDQLFERAVSVLDPALWSAALPAVAAEWRSLELLTGDWVAYATQRQGTLALAGLGGGVLAILLLAVALRRLARRRLHRPAPADEEHFSRLRSAREALKVFLLEAVVAPAAILAISAFLGGFDVVPPRVEELLHGLTVAVFIYAIGIGVARALLAPEEPWRRMPAMSDRAAMIAFRYASLAVWTLAVAAFLHATHRALIAPVSLTVATSAVMALLLDAFVARYLVLLASADEEATDGAQDAASSPLAERLSWVRFFVWLVVAAVFGALVAGYVSFAAFLASRLVVAGAVLGGLYVLYGLIDAFFTEGISADTPRARAMSKTLGLSQTNLELIGVLVSGLLKVFLFVVAAFLIAGNWGNSTADLIDSVERASFGLRIGSTTITLWSVVSAVGLLIVGLVIARGLQRWITSAILPRTGLEPSLQSSIGTIVGYVGIILVLMATIGALGINLESIAIVAGALSVGIGFGLQSIVSNFVSGLILLAERPIRVGDTIAVKGEEGYVRRISVRSTEIETFERATVIVPNTDLITGMVKNWTHTNTSGRLIVTVSVAYDADAEEVRDILVSCACDHPQVLQSPPPRVFLSRFSEMGIVFELRCVVANVDYALTVKSDLHFQILSRFRKAGINMASQPWASMGRAPADLVPRPPEPPVPPPTSPPPGDEA